MVLAEAPHRSLVHDHSPATRAYLQFFGTLCSIRTVERIGCYLEGATLQEWVQLNDDDEASQNAIYDAWRRFQATEGVPAATSELHIVFADEDESAFPTEADILFARE